jgi:putative transposase
LAMKRRRFSVEQIVAVLKQADLGLPVADLVRQTGVSEQTFYRRKKQYAGLESTQVRERKQLSQHRSTQRKPSIRAPRLELRQRMREIVQTRIRYGY